MHIKHGLEPSQPPSRPGSVRISWLGEPLMKTGNGARWFQGEEIFDQSESSESLIINHLRLNSDWVIKSNFDVNQVIE